MGLEPGGRIPAHPGDAGVYHFLEGAGQMAVGDATFAVQAGSTLVIPAGATRSLTAQTQLAFIVVRIVR